MNKTITILLLMVLIMIFPSLAASSEDDEQALAFGSEQNNEPEKQQFDSRPIAILIIIGAIALWKYKKLYK